MRCEAPGRFRHHAAFSHRKNCPSAISSAGPVRYRSSSCRISMTPAGVRTWIGDCVKPRAIAVVDAVLKEAPDDTVAADLRLLYLLRSHNDEAAEAAAVQVLAHRPSWAAYLVRGTVRLTRCDFKGAVSDCRAGLAQSAPADYRFQWLQMQLGFALWEAGDREGAAAAGTRAPARRPLPSRRTGPGGSPTVCSCSPIL